jgi:hypothetical protein
MLEASISHLAQTHFRKPETTRNCPRQNALVTRTQDKNRLQRANFSYKSNTQTNLDLRNTTLGYGFHFQHRHPRKYPIESLEHYNWKHLDTCRIRLSQGISKHQQLKKKSAATALLSAHPSDLMANLMELPDNRQLRTHLPIDLPTRYLV